MEMAESFKERLKKAMSIRGISSAELARKADLSKAQISQYTRGVYEAKQNALGSLAQALDVSEAWLMGYDVPMERVTQKPKTEDEQLVFALWGNDPTITEQDIADVRRFAEFIKQKKNEGK